MREFVGRIGASARLFGAEMVRTHRTLILGTLSMLVLLELALVVGARRSGLGPPNLGILAQAALLVLAVPLCRSWVDDDVRLGYGAYWLQKPVGVIELYAARLLANVAGALVAALGVWLVTLPAFAISGAGWTALRDGFVLTVWIPVLLAVLAFAGSAAGARNAAVVAYGILFIGFGFEGLAEALGLADTVLSDFVRLALPPAWLMMDVGTALRDRGLVAGLAMMGPLLVYLACVSGLGLALTVRVPGRLATRE